MQRRQDPASRTSVLQAEERRPRDRVTVHILALTDAVHLVRPRAILAHAHGLAIAADEHLYDRSVVRREMTEEAVFFRQALARAHADVVPLHEHLSTQRGTHQRCGRQRSRGTPADLARAARLGKIPEQRVEFGQRERRPVGLGRFGAHPVHEVRRS